jgi:hypothetical protein
MIEIYQDMFSLWLAAPKLQPCFLMVGVEMKRLTVSLWVAASLFSGSVAAAEPPSPLVGTWTLQVADTLQPDGSRVHGYGEHPQGRLMVDSQGRYSLQIYRREKVPFASGDKARGSAAEYEAAVMRVSAHAGKVRLEPATGTVVFEIAQSLFPNWEGTTQVRKYVLRGDVLSYQVPASATGNGTIAISEWRREQK